jgi:hypothetical protein
MSTHNHTWPEQYPGRKLQFADGKIAEVWLWEGCLLHSLLGGI